MVGEFGEVYVIDWGIAVRIDQAAKGEATFGGTPAYMAPEMAAAAALDQRTDVYLLGGMLYEALTGKAPHEAPTPRQMMAKVLIDRSPRRPAHTAPELADVVARAMAYHAEERFGSVAELRSAIGDFVVHRDALQIADRAEAMLARVERAEAEDPRTELLEARSSFRSALSLWEASERALEGLDECLDRLTELELSSGNPDAAAAWLAERSQPNVDLERRVEARRLARAREARELKTLRDEASDRDLAEWARAHRVRIWLYAASFVVVGFVGGVLLRAGLWVLGYLELGLIQLCFLVATIYSIRIGGGTNAMSRKMGRVMLLSALSPFVSMGLAFGLGLTAAQSMPIDLLLKSGGTVILGLFVFPIYIPSSVLLALGALLMLLFPAYPLELAAVSLAASFVTVAQGLARMERGDESA